MSTAQNLPKRTRIIVKDLLFQEQHKLTHIQVDLMAYLVNVTYWAKELEGGFYPITTKKILSDLPCLGEKTLETSLKVLKELKLIETKLVDVEGWNSKYKIRAIKLSNEGKLYNSHLILPAQDEKYKLLQQKIDTLETEKEKLQENNEALKELFKNLNIPKEDDAKKFQKVQKKMILHSCNQDLLDFIENIKKTFIKTGESICNFVPNWAKEVTFQINSYGKLSIVSQNGKEKQVKDASEINKFWLWLFKNQERVGKIIDFSKILNMNELKYRYIGTTIIINSQHLIVSDFVLEEEGIAIEVIKDEKYIKLINSKTEKVATFPLDACEKMVLEYRERV